MIENTLINKSQNKRSKFIKKYVYTLQYTKIDNDDNSCLYIWKYIYIYITTFLQAKEWYILTKFQLIIQILQDIIA
jgi:hypothetical protein